MQTKGVSVISLFLFPYGCFYIQLVDSHGCSFLYYLINLFFQLDKDIQHLSSRLNVTNMADHVNVVILSTHGMAAATSPLRYSPGYIGKCVSDLFLNHSFYMTIFMSAIYQPKKPTLRNCSKLRVCSYVRPNPWLNGYHSLY